MIYDITQPLPSCDVYPGDSRPELIRVHSMEKGELYNLSNLSICVHNGTHVDAPCHFLKDGKGIDQVSLEKMIGPAVVKSHQGIVTAEDAERIMQEAESGNPAASKRILLRGDCEISQEAAQVFADHGIDLIGNESQSVGPLNAPLAVHKILLKKEIVLLEGIRLQKVEDGIYFLQCTPLKLTGSDGSPCRAVLMDLESLRMLSL